MPRFPVRIVPGTVDGRNTFDFATWQHKGGSEHAMWVDRGFLEPDLVTDWIEEEEH